MQKKKKNHAKMETAQGYFRKNNFEYLLIEMLGNAY